MQKLPNSYTNSLKKQSYTSTKKLKQKTNSSSSSNKILLQLSSIVSNHFKPSSSQYLINRKNSNKLIKTQRRQKQNSYPSNQNSHNLTLLTKYEQQEEKYRKEKFNKNKQNIQFSYLIPLSASQSSSRIQKKQNKKVLNELTKYPLNNNMSNLIKNKKLSLDNSVQQLQQSVYHQGNQQINQNVSNKRESQQRQFNKRASSNSSHRSSIKLMENKIKYGAHQVNQPSQLNHQTFLSKIADGSVYEYINNNNNHNNINNNNNHNNNNSHTSSQTMHYLSSQHNNVHLVNICPLYKLDTQQQKILIECSQLIPDWNKLIINYQQLNRLQNQLPNLNIIYNNLSGQISQLNDELLNENRSYIEYKRTAQTNNKQKIQFILLETVKIHEDVKKKVYKKDLQDIIFFNIKVLLPSKNIININKSNNMNNIININNINNINNTLTPSPLNNISNALSVSLLKQNQISESQISSILDHSSTLQHNPASLLAQNCTSQYYQQLFNLKLSKKFSMIMKKQINNMNIYDAKTMNQYLKRLIQLELLYVKCNKIDKTVYNQDNMYLVNIGSLIHRIDEKKEDYSHIQEELSNMHNKIVKVKQIINNVQLSIDYIFKSKSIKIYNDYEVFHSGKQLIDINNPNNLMNSLISQAKNGLNEIDREQVMNYELSNEEQKFYQLLKEKYVKEFSKYKEIILEKNKYAQG